MKGKISGKISRKISDAQDLLLNSREQVAPGKSSLNDERYTHNNCTSNIAFPHTNALFPNVCDPHIKYKNIKKQKAMKLPMMIPSLLFLADILPIKLFNPGTWLAAPVMRLLMFAKVSLWIPKLSLIAYA